MFLTSHGVKLLDFGLACATAPISETDVTRSAVTMPGAIVGTPQYMAPEQARGEPAGPPSDLFAAGCVLYEMLSGRRAFEGASVIDVLHNVLHEDPPALSGPAGAVVSRAMRKSAAARYASAREMADALREAPAAPARAVTRLIALPFRARRKDEETDFLAYSLPDAISSSLAGIEALVVRSTLLAERFDTQSFDPKLVGEQAQVDVILTGTLLRAGDRLQVASQLVEAPSGTLLWSDTAQVSMRDLFQLQDSLVDRIVHSLMLPLTEREKGALKRDVPATAQAYECFLRANELARTPSLPTIREACDLYLQCVALDPGYAPAWARLGRCHRFVAKFAGTGREDTARAEAAFQRAFALNPDLALAHNLYTQMETDMGSPQDAMVRLLKRAKVSRNDPDLYAGLVQACRYCGQLEASIAAHQKARSLDPQIGTSAAFTYFQMGDYQKTLECYARKTGFYLDAAALACVGKEADALGLARSRMEAAAIQGTVNTLISSLRACLEGNGEETVRLIESALATLKSDPETIFFYARHLSRVGETGRSAAAVRRAIDEGYFCTVTLLADPWMQQLREAADFDSVLQHAREREAAAHAAFVAAGGDWVLR